MSTPTPVESHGTAGAGARLVDVAIADRVAVITLNHPDKRNALSEALLGDLLDALQRAGKQDVRAVVLAAAPGMRVWSAGHDIGELPRGDVDPLRYLDPLEQALRAVRAFPAPVIAMVHGSVWGGALDLVLCCDLVFADETATFAITPANIGLPYNTTGLLHFMARVPLHVLKEMFFTAAPLDAQQALRWGLVNHLVAEAELRQQTMAMAARIATKAPLAIAVVKEQLRILTDYQGIPAQIAERLQEMRREVYRSADYKEGIDAFLEKRQPVFQGR